MNERINETKGVLQRWGRGGEEKLRWGLLYGGTIL